MKLQGLFLLVILLCDSASAADGWQAGSAKTNITPDELMWMAGYGSRDKPAEGKQSDLWAKALVLEEANRVRTVVISLDLVGIDRAVATRVTQKLHDKYQLERKQIAICVSHTHCGPAVGRNLGPMHYYLIDDQQRALVDKYTTTLEGKIVAVVGQAIDALAPSELSWGSGRATYAVNRRANVEANVLELREAGKLQGPVDHDVPVLAVRKPSGELSAVMFGYACHSTVLSFFQWCADHPGYAQTELENAHPNCVAIFWAGCGADQNPLPRRTVELAQHYGRRLATAVDEVLLTTKMKPLRPKLTATFREIQLPLDKLPSRSEIETDAKSTNKFVASRAKLLLSAVGWRAAAQPYISLSDWSVDARR